MPTYAVTLVTSNTSIDPGYELYLIDATGGNIVMTLFDILADGQVMMFRRTDSTGNTVTIVCDGSETIDGNPTLDLPPSSSAKLVSFNDNWFTFV